MTRVFDALVIDAGQGPFLAGRFSAAGMKVAIFGRMLFGGTFVNTGQVPTKAMVASAHAARMARRAADFEVRLDAPVGVDMPRVKARKDAISDASRTGLESWLRGLENCTVPRGHARFASARSASAMPD